MPQAKVKTTEETTIIKTFGDTKPQEMQERGSYYDIPWENLHFYISSEAKVREDEDLYGFIATERGLRVKIGPKFRRKKRRVE